MDLEEENDGEYTYDHKDTWNDEGIIYFLYPQSMSYFSILVVDARNM